MLTPHEKKEVLKQLQKVQEDFKEAQDELKNHINWILNNYDFSNIDKCKEIHVTVDDSAFLTMLTSSVQTYPSNYMDDLENNLLEGEVAGHLYGDVDDDDTAIHYHVHAVSVMHNYEEQTDESCAYSEAHYQKIRYVTDAFKSIRCIGRFHSHPYNYKEFESDECSLFSPTDQESVRDSLNEYDVPPLEMILALSYLTKKKYKSSKTKESMIVNFCQRYKYVLRSFVYSFSTGRLEDVNQIRCSIAEKPINY